MPKVSDARITMLENAMQVLAQTLAGIEKDREARDKQLAQTFADIQNERKEQELSSRKQADKDRRDFNKMMGEIANKQGRLVEDIVAPSVPRILMELLGLPETELPDSSAVRVVRRHSVDPGRTIELDVMASHGDVTLVCETKSPLKPEHLDNFVLTLEGLRGFFPELKGKLLGAVSSLYIDPTLVARAERLGLVVLAVGDDLMSIINSQGFVPKRW